jgi:Zn-dependent metalloprotease
VQATPQARAGIVAQLEARRAQHGLDARHGFTVLVQHPGMQGTQVARVAHTWKGVPIFGSESVVVLDPNGRIQSESSSERRAGLGKNAGTASAAAGSGAGALPSDFSVVPAISSKQAIDKALASIGTDARHATPPSAELIIYPVMRLDRTAAARDKQEYELNAVDVEEVVDHYELAYLVHTRMHVGDRPVYHDTSGTCCRPWSASEKASTTGKCRSTPLSPTASTR